MVYTKQIQKKILETPELFAEICRITGKNAYAMAQMVVRNQSPVLRDFNVVQAIKSSTKVSDGGILATKNCRVKSAKSISQ